MRFPWIGIFWGTVMGLIGIYADLPLFFNLSLTTVLVIATLMVRDWAEDNFGR